MHIGQPVRYASKRLLIKYKQEYKNTEVIYLSKKLGYFYRKLALKHTDKIYFSSNKELMMKYIKQAVPFWIFLGLIFLLTGLSTTANAIPAFARKNNISCSACHSAWPALNKTGRSYKENGYRFAPLQVPNVKVTDHLKWDESLPVSVILVARPYDKKDSGETKVRALHEAELMIGGPMGENMSGFFEMEAEDEDTNARGLDVGIPLAQLTYNQSEMFNLQFSYGSVMYFDPYNTYTDARRLTRGHLTTLGSFGGADNGADLRSAHQNITAFGRPVSNIFYGVSFGGSGGDAEGEEPGTIMARVAVDVTPNIMLGLLSVSGTCAAGQTNCTVDRDFSRTAVDIQATVSEYLTITAVLLNATDDDATATAEEENDAMYIQALYVDHSNGRSNWAPLIRYDNYDKLNGAENITELTLGMNYYFSDNVRGMLEYWDRSGEGTTADDNRLTLQLLAAF